MPKSYLTRWTELKNEFEIFSGKIILKNEQHTKREATNKESPLSVKKDVARLKKPGEKSFFGWKSSGMETACKALDSATAAKVDAKTKGKALKTYREAEKKYGDVLRKAAKDDPLYKLVKKEIETLVDGMERIAEDFRVNHTQELRDKQELGKSIEKLESLIETLGISQQYVNKTSVIKADGSLSNTAKGIKAHLEVLNHDTVSQLKTIYTDIDGDMMKGNSAKDLGAAIRKVVEVLKGKDDAGTRELAEVGYDAVRKNIKLAITEAKDALGWARLANEPKRGARV